MPDAARILVVEDEPAMRAGLRDNLEFDGYAVDLAADGEEGLRRLLAGRYDLVVLDVMLPKRSGFDVCQAARREGVQTPIILLTAKGEELDRVLGLELGADDYVTKPFSLRELLARIKAVLRRTGTRAAAPAPVGPT
ncbi:MAG: response regulator, partial [Rhodothermales bacterium]|nr:response regulator [Rhodothermales bacterium]